MPKLKTRNGDPAPTKAQADILRYILRYQGEHGYPPTCRELAEKFRIKVSPMYWHLKRMQVKGLLRRKKGVGRGLVVLWHPGGRVMRS